MNEITEKIEKTFNENKYREALSLSCKLISKDDLLSDFEINLIEKVFVKQSNLEFEKRLIFFKKIENQKSINLLFLNSTINKSSVEEKLKIYSVAKNVLLANGRLEEVENLFSELKAMYFKYNSYSPLLKEVEELESLGIENLLTKQESIKIRYGLGDTEYFNLKFKNAISQNKAPFDISTVGSEFTDNVWRKQRFVVKEKVLINKNLVNVEEAKEFLKGIYELLIVGEESSATLKLLIKYCIEYRNKELGRECINLLAKKYDLDLKEIKLKVEGIIHLERESYEEIDLGEDLFSSEIESDDVTINKLVRQINILKQDNNLDGATKLLKELRSLDEDHSLVRELEEKEHVKMGSKLNKFKKTISEIETDLLKEIELYSTKISNKCDQRDHMERVSKKYVELTDLEKLQTEYEHLIYTFNNFEFYSVSLLLIERIMEDTKSNIEKELGLIYLKCETMRMSSNFYGALNIIEALMDDRPLTNSEKVSFLYLKGELLRSLGRNRDALKSYSKVFSLDQNFRMVVDRLKEIE